MNKCRCGETGRRKGLKIPRCNNRAGSNPASGTKKGRFYDLPFLRPEFCVLRLLSLIFAFYALNFSFYAVYFAFCKFCR